jgi:hypothetical protein
VTRRRFVVALVVAGILSATAVSQAQIICTIPCPIWDFSALLKNILIGSTQGFINGVFDDQNEKWERMVKRLSKWTPLGKYVISLDDTPEWRIHCWFDGCPSFFSKDYLSALTYGDRSGAGYDGVSVPRVTPGATLDGLSPEAAAYMRNELATIDLADSTIANATDQTGRTRFGGRQEGQAIDDLQTDASDQDDDQAVTAVMDKISGAQVIAARSKSTRLGLLSGIVEQLAIDTKRDRDVDTMRMNSTLNVLRDQGATSRQLIQNADAALTRWRQP